MWIKFNNKLVNLKFIYLITKEYKYEYDKDKEEDVFTGRSIKMVGNKTYCNTYEIEEIFDYKKYGSKERADEACLMRFAEIEGLMSGIDLILPRK
jgi:hypothetical protein